VAAKSTSDASQCHPFPPDPNSPSSTINTVAREIFELGGTSIAIAVDVRSPSSIDSLIAQTISQFGQLDAVIYNSGAIWWASVEDTPMKRFRLMQQVNVEGLYGVIQAALPHLKRSQIGGRIVVVSPPIYSRFFRGKTAYAMGKVGMSVLTKGLAMDFQRQGLVQRGMAITSIWPAVAIESGATRKMSTSSDEARDLRKATIFSDAISAMLGAPAASVNGRLELDEDFLRSDVGVTDFSKYSVVPGSFPRRIMPAKLPDLSVEEQDDEGKRMNSAAERSKL
jgi:NAD(P)-dependent dehydrogenase (short-subunit alcohol dehydrogenase family)